MTPTQSRPTLSKTEVIDFARDHIVRTGSRPTQSSGDVIGRDGQPTGLTWSTIAQAIRMGYYGFKGGESLSSVLNEHPDTRSSRKTHKRRPAKVLRSPKLTIKMILAAIEAYFIKNGAYPTQTTPGKITTGHKALVGSTWRAVDAALKQGGRGLPGGSSLIKLLNTVRDRAGPHIRGKPLFTTPQVIGWAKLHFDRTGRYPSQSSGLVLDASRRSVGVTWNAINQAYVSGFRGLPGGTSLRQVMAEHGLTNDLTPIVTSPSLPQAELDFA